MSLAAERFEAFSGQHYLLLGLFVVGVVVVFLLGRAHRRHGTGQTFSRVFAVAIPCVTLPGQVVQLSPGNFDLGSSLPLNLCDLAWIAATWALWTRQRVPVSLTYFWGLTLSVQGVLTPSLDQVFPDPRFFAFWALHFLIVWAAVYLTFGRGIGPTWRTYLVTVAVTVAWAMTAYLVNVALGVNYGYVNRKPGSESLLDLLGPWPVYVVAALGILVVGWALMTLPWELVRRRRVAAAAP